MALATQCPFCQTTFRVAQDQLKLRGGLVRCGNCKEVFNGNEHLVTPEVAQQLVATPPIPSVPPTASAAVSQTPSAWPPLPNLANSPSTAAQPTPAVAVAPAELATPAVTTPAWPAPPNLSATFASIAAETSDAPWGAATERPAESATAAMSGKPAQALTPETANINTLTQELSFPVPQTSSAPQIDSSEDDHADAAAIDKALNDLAADTAATPAPPGLLKQATAPDDAASASAHAHEEALREELQQEEPHEEEQYEEAEAEFEDDTPSFVQRAERRERLGRVLRVVMLIGIVVLSITLPLQALYVWRNQVANWLPSTRPLLSAVCAKLHCAVGLPANIEQLSLESNELQLLPPNRNIYTLTVLLRNRGAATQSWPYMELTLNDNDEKAITRRVFTPREYLVSVAQVNDGFAGNSEQQVKITFELSQPVAAGYRVYLFFP